MSDSEVNSETSSLLPSNKNNEFKAKTYKTRWLVLAVFFLHLLDTNITWSNVDSIADLAKCYYNVDVLWINSLSYLYFVTYTLFFVLATWFLEKYGLRWAAIVSGCFNAAGAWLRFSGADPNYFWLLLVGQALSSVPNIIEWSAPSLLSAVWFPPNERAFATASTGGTAPQVGVLISLLLGPLLVRSSQTKAVCHSNHSVLHNSEEYLDWQSTIHNQMLYYLLGQAVFATLLMPIAFLIPSAPPIPPSVSKHIEDKTEKKSLGHSLISLMKNVNFMLFLIVFGVLLGVSGVYITIFEELLIKVGYGDYQHQMAYLGLAIQVTAISGLIFIGRWIDYTKTFYASTLTLCIGSTVTAIGFAVCVQFHVHFYIICVFLSLAVGFVVTFQGLGYEFGVEMTFPIQESISAGLLNAISQILATLMTVLCTAMVRSKWSLYANWFIAGSLLLATILQVFIKPVLRRVKLDSPEIADKRTNCLSRYSSDRKVDIQ